MGKKATNYFKYLVGIFFVYYLFYYIPYFTEGMVLKGDDFNWTWGLSGFDRSFFFGGWNHKNGLLGGGGGGATVLTPIDAWLRILPPVFGANTLYMFMFSLMAWATYLFFRSWKVAPIPATIVATLTAFSPIFHTFIRTGHIYKIMLSPMVMFSFAFITYFFRSSRFKFSYAFLTAFSLSTAFTSGDPQVFLYFAPFFSLYGLALFFVSHVNQNESKLDNQIDSKKVGWKTFFCKLSSNFNSNRKLIPLFLLVAVMAAVMSHKTISNNYNTLMGSESTKSSDSVSAKQSKSVNMIPTVEAQPKTDKPLPAKQTPEEQARQDLRDWFWATQWSLPKMETIDLFVPGFMGFFSGSATEPYWGRVGQTEGWDSHRAGYQNYSLMNSYLGVFFAIFLIYGLFYAPRAVRIVGVISLLLFMFLAYGKFSFAYKWLYEIPYMDNFRNPNRFLQLFHFIGAIVFGFGVSHYYQRVKRSISSNRNTGSFNFFLIMFVVVIVIGLLGLIGLYSEENQLTAYFGSRFPYRTASLIVSNMFFYWIKAVIIFSLACILLHFATKKITYENAKVWVSILLLFGLVDVYVVNKKYYLYEVPNPEANQTNFHRLIKGKLPGYTQYQFNDPMDPKRMFFLKKNGELTGQYIKYLYYQGKLPLQLFDFPIVRKDIPINFKKYFSYLNNPDLRFLKIAGVHYLFSEFPIGSLGLELIYADEIKNLNEKVYLYNLKGSFPFFYTRGNVEFGDSPSTILGGMNKNSFDIYNSVMLHDGVKNILTEEQIGAITSNPENKMWFKEKKSDNEYTLRTELKTPVILVMNNYFYASWEATSGEKILPHFPANYFFNAFYLTPKDKEVTIEFKPKTNNMAFLFTNMLNYVFLAGVLFFMAKKKKENNSSKPKIKK